MLLRYVHKLNNILARSDSLTFNYIGSCYRINNDIKNIALDQAPHPY